MLRHTKSIGVWCEWKKPQAFATQLHLFVVFTWGDIRRMKMKAKQIVIIELEAATVPCIGLL